jgi:hypothetical protein
LSFSLFFVVLANKIMCWGSGKTKWQWSRCRLLQVCSTVLQEPLGLHNLTVPDSVTSHAFLLSVTGTLALGN